MSVPSKRRRRPEAQSKPGKVSEMILEFACPLLDAMGQPGRIEDLRVAMQLVMVCWNLPVLQQAATRNGTNTGVTLIP